MAGVWVPRRDASAAVKGPHALVAAAAALGADLAQASAAAAHTLERLLARLGVAGAVAMAGSQAGEGGAPPQGGGGGGGGAPAPEPGAVAGAQAEVRHLQQLAWDKLHVGHWKDVHLVSLVSKPLAGQQDHHSQGVGERQGERAQPLAGEQGHHSQGGGSIGESVPRRLRDSRTTTAREGGASGRACPVACGTAGPPQPGSGGASGRACPAACGRAGPPQPGRGEHRGERAPSLAGQQDHHSQGGGSIGESVPSRLRDSRTTTAREWGSIGGSTRWDPYLAPQVWRDLYALACLLAASAALQRRTSATSPPPPPPSTEQQRRPSGPSAAGAAPWPPPPLSPGQVFRELDLGVMMGGPAFKGLLHRAVANVEAACLPAPPLGDAATSTGDAAVPLRSGDGGVGVAQASVGGGPPRKKQRQADIAAGRDEGPAERGDQEADEEEEESEEEDRRVRVPGTWVRLPPGSLRHGAPGCSALPVLELPSLERFAAELMCAAPHGQPAVITGAWALRRLRDASQGGRRRVRPEPAIVRAPWPWPCMRAPGAGVVAQWPAWRRWQDVGYLRRVAGHRLVPVEVCFLIPQAPCDAQA